MASATRRSTPGAKRFGALEAADVRRLRQLEQENARLKKLLSEQMLHNEALRDVLSKKW